MVFFGGGGEGDIFAIFSQKLLSHCSEDFRRETLLCFKNFLVSKFSVQEGFVTFFKRVFFRLAVPRNVIGESFSRSINSVVEVFFYLRGENHDFLKETCLFTVPKTS